MVRIFMNQTLFNLLVNNQLNSSLRHIIVTLLFRALGQLVTQKINIRYLVYLSPKIRFIVKAIFWTKTEKKWRFFLIGLIWGRIQNWETAPFHIILYGLDEFIYFLYHFFCILYLFFIQEQFFEARGLRAHTWRFDKNNLHMKKSWKQSETSHCISDFILLNSNWFLIKPNYCC